MLPPRIQMPDIDGGSRASSMAGSIMSVSKILVNVQGEDGSPQNSPPYRQSSAGVRRSQVMPTSPSPQTAASSGTSKSSQKT